jgi:GT2 family glycosyltransferase
MALIAFVTCDTLVNRRHTLTASHLRWLIDATDLKRHRVFLSDDVSDDPMTLALLDAPPPGVRVERALERRGAGGATNAVWRHRSPGEVCIRVDNDVRIEDRDWADRIEEALEAAPNVGLLGVPTAGLSIPDGPTYWVTGGTPPKRWLGLIPEPKHTIMGNLHAVSSRLIDTIGGQDVFPLSYGWEDALYTHRARLAGFEPAWLPQVHAVHADPFDDGDYRAFKNTAIDVNHSHYQARLHYYTHGDWPLKQPL